MKKVSSKAMLDWLSEIAPLGELATLLNPPESLYRLENAFSTEKDASALSLAGFFFSGGPLPKKMPDYSISISAKGGTEYLTLVDNKRKIIVNAPIRASEGYWENAIVSIRGALREARGRDFVISSEDGI